jgi:DNA ligase (NAD+)
MKKLGFSVVRTELVKKLEIQKLFENYQNTIRKTFDFDIDGLVVKVNDLDRQEQLGEQDRSPKWATAYKFAPDLAKSIVESIDLAVGIQGDLTYKIRIKPVRLGGVTQSSITGHSFSFLKSLDLNIGDEILIARRGDVIAHVEKVVTKNSVGVFTPTECPKCGSPVELDGANYYCMNDHCFARRLRRIQYWIGVNRIKFIGSLADKLLSSERIRDASDLYTLTSKSFEGFERVGAGIIDRALKQIEQSRVTTEERFLAGLGIRLLGGGSAEKLIEKFGSIDAIRKATLEEIMSTSGMSGIRGQAAYEGIQADEDLIDRLLTQVKFKEKEAIVVKESSITGKRFCVTGKIQRVENGNRLTREGVEKIIKENGGILGGVDKKLDFLLAAYDERVSGKKIAAEKIIAAGGSLKIISEDEFWQMLGR